MKKLIVGVLLCLSTTAWAGLQAGLIAIKKRDCATALKELKPLALKGNVTAQYELSAMYQNGCGSVVASSDEEMLKWLRKAADQGHIEAQFKLGNMYIIGDRVAESQENAVIWWRKAAEQGHLEAQLDLGIYTEGSESVKWYIKAAEQGNAKAQGRLGHMYFTGDGVAQNFEEAVKWLTMAAAQGDKDDIAIAELGFCTAFGLGTKRDLERGIAMLASGNPRGKDMFLPLVLQYQRCLKESSTLLFGVELKCTSRLIFRDALKKNGVKVSREDARYWYDLYDSSAVLDGSSELAVAYINNSFVTASYTFNARMNTEKVKEVRDMVAKKYGEPVSSTGSPGLGEVRYTWELKDGIKVEVSRGWPDTSVTLAYIHPANLAAMKAEQARQEEAKKAEKRNQQNKAF